MKEQQATRKIFATFKCCNASSEIVHPSQTNTHVSTKDCPGYRWRVAAPTEVVHTAVARAGAAPAHSSPASASGYNRHATLRTAATVFFPLRVSKESAVPSIDIPAKLGRQP